MSNARGIHITTEKHGVNIADNKNNTYVGYNLRGPFRKLPEWTEERQLETLKALRQGTFQGFTLVCEISWKYRKCAACKETLGTR